jgi:capsular polysaccharide biosynthesis protein
MKLRQFQLLSAMIRAHWFAIVVWGLLGALGAAGLSAMIPVTYEAGARLFLATPNWNDNTASGHPDQTGRVQTYAFGDEFSQTRALSYQELANSKRVASAVIDKLGLQTTPDELATRTSGRVIPDTVMVEVSGRDASPEQAARIANAAAEALTNLIDELETPFKQAAPPVLPVLIEPAEPPAVPVQPRVALNIVAGLVLGLLVGVTYAAVRERIKAADIPEDLDVSETTLGVLHARDVPTFVALDDIPHELAEDARYLCLRLTTALENATQHGRTMLFASPRASGDVGTTVVLVASAFAELDYRVAIVLTNFAEAGSPPPEPGLGELLDGRVGLNKVLRYDDTGKVGVIVAGSTESSSIVALAGDRMGAVVEQLEDAFDCVIVTGGPVLESADSLQLASKLPAAVLICPVPQTTGAEIAESERLLGQTPTSLLGRVVVLEPSRKGDARGSSIGTTTRPEFNTAS